MDGERMPLLHSAAGSHSLEKVQMLVKAGAEVEARNRQGRTALMYACAKNRLDVVMWMVGEAGADLGAKDSDGATALTHALKSKAKEVANYLQSSVAKEVCGSQVSALWRALSCDDLVYTP
jgi:ankyrin repeat protein